MKPQKTDTELIEGIIHSDVPSYEAAYARYYPRVLSFSKGMLKNSVKAEDVAQSVFMKLWASRKSLDPSRSLSNYLFVLAKNEIINIFKSRNHTSMSYCESVPEPRQTVPGADSTVEYAETNLAVSRIVNGMPERRQEVFRMSRYEHRSIEEISTLLNLSPRTVEKHIELALKDLRRNLN